MELAQSAHLPPERFYLLIRGNLGILAAAFPPSSAYEGNIMQSQSRQIG